jgi:hypothetical protein
LHKRNIGPHIKPCVHRAAYLAEHREPTIEPNTESCIEWIIESCIEQRTLFLNRAEHREPIIEPNTESCIEWIIESCIEQKLYFSIEPNIGSQTSSRTLNRASSGSSSRASSITVSQTKHRVAQSANIELQTSRFSALKPRIYSNKASSRPISEHRAKNNSAFQRAISIES